jgi:hypothetical protein
LDKGIKSGIYPQEWFWGDIKSVIYKNLTASTV